MERIKKNRIALVLLVLILSLPSVGQASLMGWEDFLDVKEIIENEYYLDVDESLLLEGATKGLLEYLDEYSEYYTEEEFQELQGNLSGSQIGIGIYLTEEDGKVKVLGPVEDGAAHRAGIRSGDILESIDGRKLEGLSINQVIDLLVGEEETYINIVVRRGQRSLPFYIQRETLTMEAVSHRILDQNIGYISIDQFVTGVGEEVERALDIFDSKGIDRIILDLRDNPGGYLNEALKVADKIIPQGPVVHVRYKTTEKTHSSQASFKSNKYDLVLLVNENSASASEILAGAVQDRKVGRLVGSQTYGKSKVQELIKLNRGGLKLTVAEYFTPNRVNIGGKGIKPDVVVERSGDTKDQQLEAAIELFHK